MRDVLRPLSCPAEYDLGTPVHTPPLHERYASSGPQWAPIHTVGVLLEVHLKVIIIYSNLSLHHIMMLKMTMANMMSASLSLEGQAIDFSSTCCARTTQHIASNLVSINQ
jgi:hypothetical protein